MTTSKQAEANRLNAKKSTGPRTDAGKARSRMNALKTGIDAQSAIIRGEDPAKLEALTDYFHRYHPTTPGQRHLVDVLIDCEWLLRRFRVVEAQMWEGGIRAPYHPQEDIPLAQAYNHTCETFMRLQRRIDTAHRNYRAALKDIKALQAEEIEEAEELETCSEHVPEPPADQSLNSTNGFVSASS